MKRGTELKLKFKLLQKKLNLALWQTKGLLQALWDFAAENAMRGDIGRYTNSEIALAIEYEGDADELVRVLLECRWLDEHQTHRYVIHDWHEHAEDWIRKRVDRSGSGFAGTTLSEKEGVSPFAADNGGQRQTTADNGRQRPTTAENGCLPVPEPVPVPVPEPIPVPVPERSECSKRLPQTGNRSEPTASPSTEESKSPRSGGRPTTHGSGAVIATLPLANGSEAPVTEDVAAEWRRAFPVANVENELDRIRVYFASNPLKRKTPAGIGRFVTNWLGRVQDRATGTTWSPPPNANPIRERMHGTEPPVQPGKYANVGRTIDVGTRPLESSENPRETSGRPHHDA